MDTFTRHCLLSCIHTMSVRTIFDQGKMTQKYVLPKDLVAKICFEFVRFTIKYLINNFILQQNPKDSYACGIFSIPLKWGKEVNHTRNILTHT